MAGRTILATLDGKGPFERLEIALVQDRTGRLLINLREQHYAEKIGWFDQRMLELEPRQLRQLQAVLGLKSSMLDGILDDAEERATLPFPGPSDQSAPRTAAGNAH